MEFARPPSWLAPSPTDPIHYRRILSSTLQDAIGFAVDGSDLVLFIASSDKGAVLSMPQSSTDTTTNNKTHCRRSHSVWPAKIRRAKHALQRDASNTPASDPTAAAPAIKTAANLIKRSVSRHVRSHNDGTSTHGIGERPAGSADSSHEHGRDSAHQSSGPGQGGNGGGHGASSGGAGSGSNGDDDDGNRGNRRPHPQDYRNQSDEDGNSDEDDEEEEDEDSHLGPLDTRSMFKADPDAMDIDGRSKEQPIVAGTGREERLEEENNPSAAASGVVAVKREAMVVDVDADMEHPVSPPTTLLPAATTASARRPLPSSAPASGGNPSHSSEFPQLQRRRASRPDSVSSASPPQQTPRSRSRSHSQSRSRHHSQLESLQQPGQNETENSMQIQPDQPSPHSPTESFTRLTAQPAGSVLSTQTATLPTTELTSTPALKSMPSVKHSQETTPKENHGTVQKTVQKIAQNPVQKNVQKPTLQSVSPQVRRPQPPLFSESPTSHSPQDLRPQQRRPLPQARPIQLGTPIQSPIITVQNVDDNEKPHPPPGQAHVPQRSPHRKSPHQVSPHQLSPHQAGRSPRRPLPHSRGASRQPLSLSKPSPTAAEALRIMPIAAGTADADPTDPCTAHDVATFDMFWERALEELRSKKMAATAYQQQDQPSSQPPTRPPHVEQQALPEPPPSKGLLPMGVEEQHTSTQSVQSQTQQQRPKQRQLQPQPPIQPRPEQQSNDLGERPPPLLQRQFIVHVGPGQAAPRPDRRKYCRAFYEETPEEERARKKAKEERQRERMERQTVEEEEIRRQRLQLHQDRINQQVLRQQMQEQEALLRRQQQKKDLEQHQKDQEMRRQLAEQFKQQQIMEEERQRQIGDTDYYKRYLARKPPLLMLSELEEEERKKQQQAREQHDDMNDQQSFNARDQHGAQSRQFAPRPAPLERPGPLLERPGPLLERPGPLLERPGPLLERPGPLLRHSASLERPGPLLAQPAPLDHNGTIPGRPSHVGRPSKPSAVITQPLRLIATREGAVMSVDDYLDAHKRAIIEAREHLRRLEETDPLLPIECPDLVSRAIPRPPPAPAPYTVPTTRPRDGHRPVTKGVTPCPCCRQYLKGHREERAPGATEAVPRGV
ncbi:hypothetical protein F503_03605 [Ophiostoma piceae UAMH 11346]|uniref:Uncharacterized protein n=1 Tax=Ophiostoma piceae (strain UAMH 11346) TaxID=1262450 RepID=S3CDX1_OPHP1|nr:hypothetical protein F503_03605 [Ophiostoma piceae UAMH 11346]